MEYSSNNSKSGGWRPLLALAILIFALLPAYLPHLGTPCPVRSMESICMQTSLETWIRQRSGENDAWWNPTWNGGEIRIEKPPLLVWQNMLAWTGLDPASSPMEDLALRARLVTVFLTLMGIAAIYWIGLMLYDQPTALMAALAAGTFFLTIKQGHYATYDVPLMGWATLSVALGIRAMRLPASTAVRALFWTLSGIAIGGAVMTKGPVGAVWAITPLALYIALLSTARLRDALGLIIASLIGAALLLPWILHAFHISAEAMTALADEYKPVDRDQFRPVYYYFPLIVFVFPWTFWWLGSLADPWTDKKSGRERFFPFSWFLTTFAFLAVWPMRHHRYLAPLMPVCGLLCATHIRRILSSPHGTLQRRTAVYLRIFWYAALLFSIGLPIFMIAQPALLERKMIDELMFEGLSVFSYVLLGLIPLAISIAGIIHKKYSPLRISHFLLVGGWMIAWTSFAYYSYSMAGHQLYRCRADAERLSSDVGTIPVYYLFDEISDDSPNPELGFTIYARTIIRKTKPDGWKRLINSGESFFLLVPESSPHAATPPEDHAIAGTYSDEDTTWTLLRHK